MVIIRRTVSLQTFPFFHHNPQHTPQHTPQQNFHHFFSILLTYTLKKYTILTAYSKHIPYHTTLGLPYEAINHSAEAVAIAQYTASFFVQQARKSAHKYANVTEEDKVPTVYVITFIYAPFYSLMIRYVLLRTAYLFE